MDGSMELCNIVKTFEELESTRNELYCQNQELLSTICCLDKTVEKLEKVHKEDKALICKHETCIEIFKKEIKDLQCTIQRKNQDIAECSTLYKVLENLEKENDRLLKDKEICEAQLCKFKDIVSKLECKFKEKDCVINMQANQLDEIQMKLKEYKCKFEAMFEETRESREQKECYEKLIEELRTEKEIMCEKLQECEVIKFKLEDCNKKNQGYIKELKKELAIETARNAELCVKINLLEEEVKEKNCQIIQLQDNIGHLTRKLNAKENEIEYCMQELERKKEEFVRYKSTIAGGAAGLQDRVCNKPEKRKCVPMIDSFYCPCHITNSQPTLQRFSYIKSRKSFFDRLFREHNQYLLNTPKKFQKTDPRHEQFREKHCYETSSEKTVKFDEKLNMKCDLNKSDKSEKIRNKDEGNNKNETKPSEATDKTIGNGENNKIKSRSNENFVVMRSPSKDRKKDRPKSQYDEKRNIKAPKSKKDKSPKKQERKIEIHKEYIGRQSPRSRSRKRRRHESKNQFVLSKASHHKSRKKK
ncbi:hypothetical protein WDU94_013252 [Cyamophila willieti]